MVGAPGSELSPLLNGLVDEFVKSFRDMVGRGLITGSALKKYRDNNIHSIFQYCLMEAGRRNGLLSLPEFKLRLSRPINRAEIKSKEEPIKIKYMRTMRVDVGFLRNSELIGVGEVYTPDEIHGCLPSWELPRSNSWITPYHKLLHLAEYEKEQVRFAILVVGAWMNGPWPDAHEKEPREWVELWRKLAGEVEKRGVATRCVVVWSEELVEPC